MLTDPNPQDDVMLTSYQHPPLKHCVATNAAEAPNMESGKAFLAIEKPIGGKLFGDGDGYCFSVGLSVGLNCFEFELILI